MPFLMATGIRNKKTLRFLTHENRLWNFGSSGVWKYRKEIE